MDRRLEKLLPVARWPTAEEAAGMRWFSPLQLGPVRAEARTWIPAMVPWRATADGFVTDEVIGWYRRFAEGEPGVLVVEATGIRDVPSGPLLRAGHDRYVDGLARLVEAVREASGGKTRLFIQLIDFLSIKRRPSKENFFRRFLVVQPRHRDRLSALLGEDCGAMAEPAFRERLLGLSEVELPQVLSERELDEYRQGFRERVTDVERPHIAALPAVLPGLFAAAALRCEKAGFDGVELHYAHAYTMASFLSARNTRADGYGGPREQRVRLPLEVFAHVRGALKPSTALGCRFLGDEVIDGGNRIEDAGFFGVQFARAGMDFLSISKGGKFEDAKQPKVGAAAYPYTGPSGHECMPTTLIGGDGPFGRNVSLSAAVRSAVRQAGFATPVVAAGGIASPWQAEEILELGEADAVAAARQSLADPDWFKKVRLGRGAEVRRCFFTNYCEGLDQAHKVVTCQRWDRPRAGEPGHDDVTAPRTADGRRLLAPRWTP